MAICSRRGSVTVFLTSILITMIMVSMVFVHAARDICGASYCDAVLELAGRSALSEFDRRLKDEYGLFAFYGNEDMVKSLVRFYAAGAFDRAYPGEAAGGGKAAIDMFSPKMQRVEVSLASYSLMDAEVLEEQIEEYMNYLMAEKGVKFVKGLWKKGGGEGEGAKSEERTLVSQAEINSLPSKGNVTNGIDIPAAIASGLPSLDRILDEGTMNFKVNEYIMSHFKHGVGGDKEKNTFFANEVEYVLYGKTSDKGNADRLRIDFLLMRTALNAAHIAASPSKRTAAIALAETFGAAAPVALPIIIAAWGAAEAENDARRLLAGKNVALAKTDATWALDLKAAISVSGVRDDEGELVSVETRQKRIKGYISPQSDEGLSYPDYLRIFLFLEAREAKLLRVMDLIQLNLRGSYYGDFLIKDHYTGFSLKAKVSGKTFEYEQKY